MIRAAVALFFFLLPVLSQEPIYHDINTKIRREAMENSKILRTVHYLTDIFGPRLTGSPQQQAAGEWAARQLTGWGLVNGRLEPWDFARPSWSNQRAAAFLTAPVEDTLVVEALAWTPGTDGIVTGPCVRIDYPANPTEDELFLWLAEQTENVRGKIVLTGVQPAVQPVPPIPVRLTAAQVSDRVDQFLLANGVLVRINDSGRPLGQIRVYQNRTYDVRTAPPTLVMRSEDFGRISRLLGDGLPVEMEVQISVRTHPEGRIAYNVLAEIPGTDKSDEVVMLGAHIDSWHAATGAIDNATGVAVMMEAVRILKVIGAEPRRTIRIALWSGEEQGLLGSQVYVAQRFGTAEAPRADFSRLVAYFNLDYGTGRVTGLTVFGPAAAAEVLTQILGPFAEDGVSEAKATTSRRLSSSDYTSFWRAGLPGITLVQEPLDYDTSWHTNLDTYERVREDDLKQAAMVAASAVYHLAVRDQILPRFAPWEMPRPNLAPGESLPVPVTSAPASGASR